MAHWSKQSVIEFIKFYRSKPCLWKSDCREYRNRLLREAALKELTYFSKKFEPTADKNLVLRKINNLRTSFRKEVRKVIQSQEDVASGTIPGSEKYEPKLFYFDQMLFLEDSIKVQLGAPDSKNQNDAEDGNSSNHSGGGDDIQFTVTKDDDFNSEPEDEMKLESVESETFDNRNDDDTHCAIDTTNSSQISDNRLNTKSSSSTSNGIELQGTPCGRDIAMTSRQPSKRKRTNQDRRTISGGGGGGGLLFSSSSDYHHQHSSDTETADEHDVFGKYVAHKLRRMSAQQSVFAERIISQVLFEGHLGDLTMTSHLSKG